MGGAQEWMERVREHKNKIAGLRESEDSTRERERERMCGSEE